MSIDPDAEPLFSDQWYLENTGQSGGLPGADINVRGAWDLATGEGVSLAVNDTGIALDDPDLQPNLDTDRSGNFVSGSVFTSGGPDPTLGDYWHGTAVAALAASDDNGVGFMGVAPDTTLASLVGLGTAPALDAFAAFDVVNASWGVTSFFADDFNLPNFAQDAAEIRQAATQGRDGLGTIMVFASGNDFTKTGLFGQQETGVGDANYHNFQNSRFTIAVGALDDEGTFAAPGNPAGFTTPGAPVLVAAPGTEVLTADLPGTAGRDQTDTTVVNGTSFAAPLVSGVTALMLDATPDLGLRDVQKILAYTARQNDPDQAGWITNGAGDWNGGGLHSNTNYGFGLVDAAAAVRLAASWRESSTAGNEAAVSESRAIPATISNTRPPVEQTVTLDAGVDVETVAVDIDLSHANFGDVTIVVTSPSGTRSTLVQQPDAGDFGAFSRDGYRLTSNEFHGEASAGTWTLQVFDSAHSFFQGTDGTLFDWTLTAYGSPADADDSYIYTDEFGRIAADDPNRATLRDEGGTDDLNAAAVSTAVTLDLSPGTTSRIAGRDLTIDRNTQIENAFGGAGADTIRGNALANRLEGGLGGDTLSGLAGQDTLVGGRGPDTLDGGDGDDTALFDGPRGDYTVDIAEAEILVSLGSEPSVLDRLTDIEFLAFDDRTVDVAAERGPAPAASEPAGRVFLADGGGLSLVHAATVFGAGGTGTERLFLGENASGVRTDANIERLDIARSFADVAFDVTDQGLEVSAAGTTLLSVPSLNQTTELHFTDGDLTVTQTAVQTFELTGGGGAAARVDTLGADTSGLDLGAAPAARPGAQANPAAKVFLESEAVFSIAEPVSLFGASGGDEAAVLASGTRGVDLDANLERLDIDEPLADLRFDAGGEGLEIASDGATLVTIASLNQDLDLRLSDGNATLRQAAVQTFDLIGAEGDRATIQPDGGGSFDVALGPDSAGSVGLPGVSPDGGGDVLM